MRINKGLALGLTIALLAAACQSRTPPPDVTVTRVALPLVYGGRGVVTRGPELQPELLPAPESYPAPSEAGGATAYP